MRGGDDHRHRDPRGSSKDRKARRQWLWDRLHSWISGTIACHHCYKSMFYDEFQIDRWPICGHNGGTYRRDNIVPSCVDCNGKRACCQTKEKVKCAS